PGPAPGGGQGDGGQRDGGHGRGGHGDGAVVPALVLADRLVPWSPVGYGPPVDRPPRGAATVLTPAPTVDALAHGYAPVIHPGATG
ncbi:MAG TPA: hypothetical protein VFI47_26550, partial [Acidimicrobiales bacterium]|nr:hypothetical protein [Acidimicrobiales bacterium]